MVARIINTDKGINDKDPKFKVVDHVRISKYKNIFAKGYTPNWSEEEFRIEKVIKQKGDKIYVKWKGYDNSFSSWIDKKRPNKYIKMSQYFPKSYEPFGGDINVKVDLSNYATKTDLKNISHIDVSSYALKPNLVSLKTEVDKLDIDKLTTVPIDLAKLSNAIKNDAVKKTEYDKLVNKVNGIDDTNFVSRIKYEKDGSDFEDKIDKI